MTMITTTAAEKWATPSLTCRVLRRCVYLLSTAAAVAPTINPACACPATSSEPLRVRAAAAVVPRPRAGVQSAPGSGCSRSAAAHRGSDRSGCSPGPAHGSHRRCQARTLCGSGDDGGCYSLHRSKHVRVNFPVVDDRDAGQSTDDVVQHRAAAAAAAAAPSSTPRSSTTPATRHRHAAQSGHTADVAVVDHQRGQRRIGTSPPTAAAASGAAATAAGVHGPWLHRRAAVAAAAVQCRVSAPAVLRVFRDDRTDEPHVHRRAHAGAVAGTGAVNAATRRAARARAVDVAPCCQRRGR